MGPSILGYPRFLNSKDRLHGATAKNENAAKPPAAEEDPAPAPLAAAAVEGGDETRTAEARPSGRKPEVVQLGWKVLAVLTEELPIFFRADDVTVVHPPNRFLAEDILFVLKETDRIKGLAAEFEGNADAGVERGWSNGFGRPLWSFDERAAEYPRQLLAIVRPREEFLLGHITGSSLHQSRKEIDEYA